MRSLLVGLVVVVAVLLSPYLYGQSAGDFRSKAGTLNWNSNLSWERYNGTAWVGATFAPTNENGIVTVSAGSTISLSGNEIFNQTVVNGTLRVNTGITVTFRATPTGDVITVNNGGSFEITGAVNQNANSIIRVKNGGKITANQGSNFNGFTTSNLFFEAGGTYQHSFTSTAGVIPIANWDAASTFLFKGVSITLPTNINQSFGNITIDVNNTTGTLLFNNQLATVRGNFKVASTNQRQFYLGTNSPVNTVPLNLTINGDLDIAGVVVRTTNSTAGINHTINVGGSFKAAGTGIDLVSNGNMTLNVAKDFLWTAGTITKSWTAAPPITNTVTINFNGTTAQSVSMFGTLSGAFNFSVASNAIVNLGTAALTGSGTFTLNQNGHLIVGSNNGLGAIVTGNAGNIRVAGARTFVASPTNGTIIEYVSPAIAIGDANPSATGFTTVVNNAAGMTFGTTNVTINGDLTLQSGNLNIATRTLSLGGTFTPNANSLVVDNLTKLLITSAGTTNAFGSINLSGVMPINELAISGPATRVVQLGADFSTNVLTLTGGDLQLNGHKLTIEGDITQGTGLLTGSAASSLEINSQTGVNMPADLQITGGALNILTFNRSGATLHTTSSFSLDSLYLVNGTVDGDGTITMNAAGKITVTSGLLQNPVAAVSVYDVEYNGLSDILTGTELPVSSTVLRNFINNSQANVLLSAPATIGGNLLLNSGTLTGNGQNVTLIGNFVSNSSSTFVGSSFTFDGTSTLSGIAIPDFGTVNINATKSLIITDVQQINIAGDFQVNGTFTPAQGIVSFNGTTDQSISGSGTSPFYALEVNKATGQLNLSKAADIIDVLRIITPTTMNIGTNLLTIVSDATRTARVNPVPDLASIVGTAIVQRYMINGNASRQYRYIASPVTNSTVKDWQNEFPITGSFSDPSTGPGIVSGNASLFYYNESLPGATLTARYVAYPTSGTALSNPIVNGRGYAAYFRPTTAVVTDTRGTLAQHTQVINVTAQTNGGIDGWNLIGNPYASPVAWDQVTRSAGVGDAIYITDNTQISGGSLVTYVNGVSVPNTFNGAIDMGQGFWIHTTANGSVTFDETDKVISTDSVGQLFRRGNPSELLRMKVVSPNGKDELAIMFDTNATDAFDQELDALKLAGTSITMASRGSDNREMTINTMSSLDCNKSIPIILSNMIAGSHTISIEGTESFGSDVDLLLVDAIASKTIDLRSGSYTFNVTDLVASQTRFTLKVGKTRFTDITVANSDVCFDGTAAVTLEGAQPEVEYQLMSGDNTVSDWTRSNGGQVYFNLSALSLQLGQNQFSVNARNGCNTFTSQQKPVVTRYTQPKIISVTDAKSCQGSAATLVATGAQSGQVYRWFTSVTATDPFKVESTGTIAVDGLTADATYYVEVANAIGCSSNRQPVNIKVVTYPEVTLTQEGSVLISSYEQGNQWFFNGNPVQNANRRTLIMSASGTYSVKVDVNGCTTEAELTEAITGLEDPTKPLFVVFPNPTSDKIYVQVNENLEGNALVTIQSMTGVQVYSAGISVAPGSRSFAIPAELTPGVYIVRVRIDNYIFEQKVVRL